MAITNGFVGDGRGEGEAMVLVLEGREKTTVAKSQVDRIGWCFKEVRYRKWEREGDEMAGCKEEMMPVIRFFARELRSWKKILEGGVEVG